MEENLFRTEKDSLGIKEIPIDALYGINALRAKENFPIISPFKIEWYKAIGLVKAACYLTQKNFKAAILQKYRVNEIPFSLIPNEISDLLYHTAIEISNGQYFEHFIVPAIQGGAGTSINMNINEIIANACLGKMNENLGNYNIIDPIEHANVYQSTNDVIPTALRIATLQLLNNFESSINELRKKIEQLEKKHINDLRIGYTQMQEAVPSSYGKLFSTYSEALSRDWWRISKCFERIKVVNLGGSAIGTGITVPRYFIMEVVSNLQELSKLPITRSENLSDTTANLDSFVEVHAILKAHAVNLEKMANDMRLLGADILQNHEVNLPQKQVGSSIMPSKVNPVIPEFIISVSHKVYANDNIISSLCGLGCLDLNAYIPLIGDALLDSLELLIAADKTFAENLFDNIIIDNTIAAKKLYNSPSVATALVPYIGYNYAGSISKLMREKKLNIIEANNELQLIEKEFLLKILEPSNLLKAGFSLNDISLKEKY